MSPIDVTPESLLKWLKSGQFRKDYSELPEPLPKAMGGAVYRAQLVPIKVRQVTISRMFPEGEGIPPKLFQALKECEEQERRNREAAKQRALPVGTSAQTARAVGRPGVQYPPLASSSTAPSNGGVVDPSPIDAMQDILQTVGECLPVGLQNDTSNRLDAAAKALSAAHKQTQSATEAEQLTTKQLRSAITQYQLTLDRYKELVSCIG